MEKGEGNRKSVMTIKKEPGVKLISAGGGLVTCGN